MAWQEKDEAIRAARQTWEAEKDAAVLAERKFCAKIAVDLIQHQGIGERNEYRRGSNSAARRIADAILEHRHPTGPLEHA